MTRPLAALLLILATLVAAVPAAAQTPVASPDPGGFVLVATIEADEWVEPLPEAMPGVDLGDRTLPEALREGGFVIYFRHAATDTAADQNVDFRYCSTQRNLSQLGKDQAAEIGVAFEALEIPVGEVRSSEFCRAKETAELAFGKVTPDPMLTPFVGEIDEGEDARKTAALVELLSTSPEPGTNRMIVAHQYNITEAAGVDLEEGEAAVFLSLE